MYEAHFHLGRKPFASHPEPEMMYWAEGHKMARTMLVYGLTATSGIVVITGEIGSGKTTLLNHILSQDTSGHVLGRLNGAVGLGDDVCAWVLYGMGMDPGEASPTRNLSRLQSFLSELNAQRRKAVLLIEEAYTATDLIAEACLALEMGALAEDVSLPVHVHPTLSEGVMEELRLLSDMQMGGQPVLQLVLLGQPELARILNQPILMQFRQRIVSHYHLKALSPEETISYVESRISQAGGGADLFTKDALRSLHSRTDGIPRRINILCDTAFVYAFAHGETRITRDTLDKVVDDRSQHGLLEIG